MSEAEWIKTDSRFTQDEIAAVAKDYPLALLVVLDDQETQTDQEKWLNDALAKSQLQKSQVYCERISEHRFKLSFKSFRNYAEFHLKNCADTKGGFPPTCEFNFISGTNEEWVESAKAFLNAAKITHSFNNLNGEAVFKFDYFSGLAAFREAVDNGEIDQMANAILRAKKYRGETVSSYLPPTLLPYRLKL